MSQLGRNEACHCGSGRKYKNCHLEIDDADGADKYRAAQHVYMKNWARTSQLHFEKGYYHWMAECLLPYSPKRILDIGCGSGHGLAAILDTFQYELNIIGIDENFQGIKKAETTLRDRGHSALSVNRLNVGIEESGFVWELDEISDFPEEPIVLVEGDICADPPLIATLLDQEKFNAVTVWLTGSHMMRQHHSVVREKSINNEGELRLMLQNNIYELADQILEPGGVLQVVDRAQAPDTDELSEDWMNAHREQAEPTSLHVQDMSFKIYEEPKGSKTPVLFTPGTSGQIPDAFNTAFVSVISIKQ